MNISVTYSNGTVDGPVSVPAGAKQSFPGCGRKGTLNPAGFLGSATITAPGGTIVGIGKVGGAGMSTAFVGVSDGSAKLNLPYVRWTQANWDIGAHLQRVNIAIQNVGTTTLAQNSVTIKYYDRNGVLVGTHTNADTVAVGEKFNSNPHNLPGGVGDEFGYYSGGATGGGAVVEGPVGSKLAVIARVNTYLTSYTSTGEDYNGIP